MGNRAKTPDDKCPVCRDFHVRMNQAFAEYMAWRRDRIKHVLAGHPDTTYVTKKQMKEIKQRLSP